jgi:hypothetical protein
MGIRKGKIPYDPERLGAMGEMVFYPQEAATATMNTILAGGDHENIGWPMPFLGMDTYVAPLPPTHLRLVTAHSQNFKTTYFLAEIMANAQNGLLKDNSYVIFITAEETIEEIIAPMIAVKTGDRVRDLFRGMVKDGGKLDAAVAQVEKTNIIVVGDSIHRETDGYGVLTSTNIARILERFVKGESKLGDIHVAAVYIDYLQALPLDPELRDQAYKDQDVRRLAVKNTAFYFKDITKSLRLSTIVGSQAREKLSAPLSMYFPGFYEDHESTDPVRRADSKIVIWVPSTTHTPGSAVKHGEMWYTAEENYIWFKIWKQRRGWPSRKAFFYRADFDTLALTPMGYSGVFSPTKPI